MIYALGVSRTGNKTDAEDITQDVFFKYLESGKKFFSQEHLKAWLIRVTINLTINMYRAYDRQKRVDVDKEMIESKQSDVDFLTEVENNLVFEERIDKLNPKYRTVMLLRFDCGYRIKDIAKLIGESEENVKTWLKRGKKWYNPKYEEYFGTDSKEQKLGKILLKIKPDKVAISSFDMVVEERSDYTLTDDIDEVNKLIKKKYDCESEEREDCSAM